MSAVSATVRRVEVPGVGPLDRAELVADDGQVLRVEYRLPQEGPPPVEDRPAEMPPRHRAEVLDAVPVV